MQNNEAMTDDEIGMQAMILHNELVDHIMMKGNVTKEVFLSAVTMLLMSHMIKEGTSKDDTLKFVIDMWPIAEKIVASKKECQNAV